MQKLTFQANSTSCWEGIMFIFWETSLFQLYFSKMFFLISRIRSEGYHQLSANQWTDISSANRKTICICISFLKRHEQSKIICVWMEQSHEWAQSKEQEQDTNKDVGTSWDNFNNFYFFQKMFRDLNLNI